MASIRISFGVFAVISDSFCNRAKKLRKKCAKIVVHTKERKSPNLIVKILNSKLKK